ncbi:MAG: hypothetical protein Q4B54_05195 [Coriobacteriales bacterium]|nr:hypothetical protein [Coriobacteriales bacterium]
MKRFIALAVLMLALTIGAYFAYFHLDIPIDFHAHQELRVAFRAEGARLQRGTESGFEDLQLRGVELSSALPGQLFSDYAATKEDYGRWMEQIAEMGANTMVVTQLMDSEFYDALLDYNNAHADPLFLVQGVMAEEDLDHASENAYASGLMDRLISQGKTVLDVVHGRRDVTVAGLGGSGFYRSDVSAWVAAIVILDEFDVDTVAYTDGSSMRSGVYQGEQFCTTADATPFEAMLARVMDEVATYESTKYDMQRPVGFCTDARTDPLEYEEVYARQLSKYVSVNAEHVVPSDKNKAGSIAGYRITDVRSDYATYLSAACKAELKEELASADKTAFLGGYLKLLSAYHSMPLLAFFSSSTARTTDSREIEPVTEKGQGEALCAIYDALQDAKWSGAIISSWQDVWSRSSWNTIFATFDSNSYRWHDLLTPTQCEGLLAFDPGNERVCVLDGKPDEWEQKDLVCKADGMELYARQDAEGIYLLVKGLSEREVAYLPLDVSPEVGVSSCADPALSFNGKPEFVLCLEGKEDTRLLVQSRYNATRQRFLYEIEGEDPFLEVVAADDTSFEVARLAQSTNEILTQSELLHGKRTYLHEVDAGALVHGNGDPASADYSSLADLCYGSDCVEVRIPWLLINVGDPSNTLVHRDYYECYGVEFEQVPSIGMGLGRKGQKEAITFEPFALQGWKNVTYTERLKQSYEVVRAAWTGGA